ncbi:ankyrin repeat-containing domain protein [Aspergillus pseudotamarii]|uniref:Ankyrin repeat-containing domain protein n=1 Tax=Aspergillus pseudotamarii TaxID=132259 RepID=A0A5N6SAZ4_ASPPS|nr:ankyrin repeat-containing domain protein [Aspergillus pseudotamarii]KAE8131019.1 ankyrin repeat-containing domain protein [Aspergillus pseudotamarii]
MRLLKTTKSEVGAFEIELFTDDQLQYLPYAILSHTWGPDEVTLQNINEPVVKSWKGYKKIEECCSMAHEMGYEYVWIDTCCIDKTSSAELSEAINSMFVWYQEARVCYAYLYDVPSTPFEESRWFTRGWTLQELIAPQVVIFFNRDWEQLGNKTSLGRRISQRTRIPESILSGEKDLDTCSTAQRMSWAAERQTTRVEDRAYCLMGLFGVNMPLIYGERESAFIRLQEEILRISEDHSLFAWKSSDTRAGLLATSPAAFIDSHDIVPHDIVPWETFDTRSSPLIISGKGIHLDLCLIGLEHVGLGLAVLQCKKVDGEYTSVGIFVHDPSLTLERFKRVHCDDFRHLDLKRYKSYQYRTIRMCIQAGRMARSQRPRDSEQYNIFSPIRIYLESEPIRITNWHSSMAEVYLWLLVARGSLEATLSKVSKNRTPLAWAAQQGLEGFVRVLLKRGAAIELGGEMIDTPLSLASRNGHTAIAKLLLDKGANIEARGSTGQTPLMDAICAQDIDIVNVILSRNPDINASDRHGVTPLIYAIRTQDIAIIDLILSKNPNIEAGDSRGDTPLINAIRTGDTATINAILNRNPNMEAGNIAGQRPLIHALDVGNRTTIKMLLEKGADIEARDAYGRTPLLYAITLTPVPYDKPSEIVNLVDMLIQHGADINARTRYGETALQWATSRGCKDIVDLLKERDPITKARRETAMSRVSRKSHQGIFRLFKSES